MLKELLKFDHRYFRNKGGEAFRGSGVLPEAERLPLVSGTELGDARRQAWRKEHIDLCWEKTKTQQQNRNLLLLLHIFIALRRGKRWSSKIIENTHG